MDRRVTAIRITTAGHLALLVKDLERSKNLEHVASCGYALHSKSYRNLHIVWNHLDSLRSLPFGPKRNDFGMGDSTQGEFKPILAVVGQVST